MMEFFDMNGYGLYVWPAYGTALTLLIGLMLSSLRQNKRLKQELETFSKPQS